jgi:hypothetical protein
MDESELVIVCHCEKHPQLYRVRDNHLDTIIDNTRISFVDPDICTEKTWDKIETSSKKYVFAFNCPFGGMLSAEVMDPAGWQMKILFEVLENSKRVLKAGGQFISGISNAIDIDTFNLDKFTGIPELSGWKITAVKGNDFTFNLGKSQPGNPPDIKRNLLVFTKLVEGGRRKRVRRITRKRKTRRK